SRIGPKPKEIRPDAENSVSIRASRPMAIPQSTASAKKPKKGRHRRRRRHVWKDKHYRWVETPDGDWRVEGYIVRHKHKPRRHHYRGPGRKPPRRITNVAVAAVNPDPRPPGAYQGPFGRDQAVRLLGRAGFGAVPGQAE